MSLLVRCLETAIVFDYVRLKEKVILQINRETSDTWNAMSVSILVAIFVVQRLILLLGPFGD